MQCLALDTTQNTRTLIKQGFAKIFSKNVCFLLTTKIKLVLISLYLVAPLFLTVLFGHSASSVLNPFSRCEVCSP